MQYQTRVLSLLILSPSSFNWRLECKSWIWPPSLTILSRTPRYRQNERKWTAFGSLLHVQSSLKVSRNIMFHGNIVGLTDGTSLMLLWPDDVAYPTFSPLAATTAPTVIPDHTLVRSGQAEDKETQRLKETKPSPHKHIQDVWLRASTQIS